MGRAHTNQTCMIDRKYWIIAQYYDIESVFYRGETRMSRFFSLSVGYPDTSHRRSRTLTRLKARLYQKSLTARNYRYIMVLILV